MYRASMIICTGIGAACLAGVLTASLASVLRPSKGGETMLDARVKTAREIRDALAAPLPPLEPLPPISTRVAQGKRNQVGEASPEKSRPPRKVPIEARDAMARAEWTELLRSVEGVPRRCRAGGIC